MSATIEEITRLIDEGYTVSISKPNAGIVSVRVTAPDKRLVSSSCQPRLDNAVSDAYAETPERVAEIVNVIAQAVGNWE